MNSQNARTVELSPASPVELPAQPLPTVGARGVTRRAVVLGCLLIPLNAFWIVRLERVMYGPYPSTISLFANVVFELFVFLAVNKLCLRIAPRFAFTQSELLTIYTMLAISTGIAGLDGVGILSQMIPHGAWFGTVNKWDEFLGSFPGWLIVDDRTVLRGHYLGNSNLYRPEVLRAFAAPVLAWTGFITVLLFVANCINVLVRRQWADQERLTFPIIWLPMEMTDGGAGQAFFVNKLMWAGFSAAFLLSLWNGIAFLYPSLPAVNVGITDLKPFLVYKPWNAIDWMPVTFYPLAIGLGFLLPIDLLFSCWFFLLYWKAQVVVSSAMAWDATPDFPFIKEQGFGSILGLAVFYFWTGRKTYAQIWKNALSNPQPTRDSGTPEAMTDRTALLGIAGGTVALVLFCMAAGVAVWVAVTFFVIYFATITVITRIRAELGAPVHDFHFMGPDSMLPRVVSAHGLRQADMAFFTFTFALTRAHRSDTMPIGLEGLQMAKLRQMDARRMFAAIMLATVVGTLAAFWAFEHQAYALGAAAKFNQGSGHAQQAFVRMNNWVNGSLDSRPNGQAAVAMIIGVVTTLGLLALRLRFFGFPLHPLGYAIASSWAIHLVWVPLLIAWVLKGITLRYGGLPAYRRILPFFLGLILGDCVMGSIWALLSLILNVRTYNFFGA